MSEWKCYKLSEISSLSNGINFDKSAYTRGVKLIGVSDFKNRIHPDYDSLQEVDSKVVKSGDYLEKGDIVFVRSNGNKELVGRCMMIDRHIPVTYSGFCIKLRFKDKKLFESVFFNYLFRTRHFKKSMTGTAVGANIQNLSQSRLGNCEVNVPDIETQKRIATILSRYDSLIENYQKQIKLLEEAAQRLYKEWFVDLHFPGHENTKIVDGVPEGWEKKKLHDFAEVVMGSSPKSEFYNNEKQGLPFHQGVGSYGTRFVDDNVYTTSITRLAKSNSILFSVRAPVGRLNITKNKIVIGRGLAAMNHKDGFQSFLFYMLKDRFFMDNIIGNGSIFASISKVELLGQEFIVPPMKTIKAFESFASKLDKKIESVDTQIRLLTEARDRLLPKLMNGEIKV
jgi:type I restriction enzyme S subunit